MKIPQNWTFHNPEVANHFDAHVREQLPWYDLTTQLIAHFGRHYIPNEGTVYDIGASTGNIGKILQPTLQDRKAHFIAIEKSKEMVEHYVGPSIPDGQHRLEIVDALEHEYEPYDFAVCFLVLMFLPTTQRRSFVDQLAQKVRPGGAVIFFDRFLPQTGYVGTVLTRMSMAAKLANGASPEDVISKELSLAGVQRPLDAKKDLPLEATQIFAFGDFRGYIYEA